MLIACVVFFVSIHRSENRLTRLAGLAAAFALVAKPAEIVERSQFIHGCRWKGEFSETAASTPFTPDPSARGAAELVGVPSPGRWNS